MIVLLLGKASLRFAGDNFVKGEDEPASTGEIAWVNADQSTGKSAPAGGRARPDRRAGQGPADDRLSRGGKRMAA